MGAGGSTALVTSLSMIADLIGTNTVREIVFSYKKFLKYDADSAPASKCSFCQSKQLLFRGQWGLFSP